MKASLLATEHFKHYHQLLTYLSITDCVGSLFFGSPGRNSHWTIVLVLLCLTHLPIAIGELKYALFSSHFLRETNLALLRIKIRILLGIRIIDAQSNGYSPERKPVIMRKKHVWFVGRMCVTTIQTRISKGIERFSRMVMGSSALDLL